MLQYQLLRSSSYRETLKALEADIQHANTLAAAIPRAYGGEYLQMKLSYSPLAPIFFFLMQWMDCSCTYSVPSYLGLLHVLIYKVHLDGNTTLSSYERKASLKEFYAVIYPSLQQLEAELAELEEPKQKARSMEIISRKRVEERRKLSDKDAEREDECGICMEACSKIVLPNCNHAMCIGCYRDWNLRSQSCPFCRGSLKRVSSRDLWVLTGNGDVIDTVTLAKENLTRFYVKVLERGTAGLWELHTTSILILPGFEDDNIALKENKNHKVEDKTFIFRKVLERGTAGLSELLTKSVLMLEKTIDIQKFASSAASV